MPLSQYLFSYKLACLRSSQQPRRARNRDFQDVTNIRLRHNSDLVNMQWIMREFCVSELLQGNIWWCEERAKTKIGNLVIYQEKHNNNIVFSKLVSVTIWKAKIGPQRFNNVTAVMSVVGCRLPVMKGGVRDNGRAPHTGYWLVEGESGGESGGERGSTSVSEGSLFIYF